jgi:hypothetical protein
MSYQSVRRQVTFSPGFNSNNVDTEVAGRLYVAVGRSRSHNPPDHSSEDGPSPLGGANGTWVTVYYQDMGYSFRRRAAGFLPPGNA